MKKTYDHDRATRLVPLLEAISGEITERTRSVRRLDRRIKDLGPAEERLRRELVAEIANHRTQLRLARLELERLGCVEDQGRPRRILIPGTDGGLETGFAWDAGDDEVQRVTPHEEATSA